MAELKPCPFCGGKGRKFRMLHNKVTHKISFIAEVGCDLCNAKMLGLGATPDEANDNAIKAWNTRTPKERGADKTKITCLNCKHLMFSDMYGECNKQLKIVNPSDTCEYAELKERVGEK